MQVTLKLYAWLTDFLPPEARKDNRVSLQMQDGATVTEILKRQSLPAQQCHLVLINGVRLSDPQTGHHVMNLPVDWSATEALELSIDGL